MMITNVLRAAVQNIALTTHNAAVFNAAVVAIGPLQLCLSGNNAAAQAAARAAVSLTSLSPGCTFLLALQPCQVNLIGPNKMCLR